MPRSNVLSVTSVPPRGRRTDCPSSLLVIAPAYRSSSAARPFGIPPPEDGPADTAPTARPCPTRSIPDSPANGSEKTRGGIRAMPEPRCLSAVPVPASACRRWSIGARFLTQPRSRKRRCRSSKRSAESTPLSRELGVCATRERRGARGRDESDYFCPGPRAESRNASASIGASTTVRTTTQIQTDIHPVTGQSPQFEPTRVEHVKTAVKILINTAVRTVRM